MKRVLFSNRFVLLFFLFGCFGISSAEDDGKNKKGEKKSSSKTVSSGVNDKELLNRILGRWEPLGLTVKRGRPYMEFGKNGKFSMVSQFEKKNEGTYVLSGKTLTISYPSRKKILKFVIVECDERKLVIKSSSGKLVRHAKYELNVHSD